MDPRRLECPLSLSLSLLLICAQGAVLAACGPGQKPLTDGAPPMSDGSASNDAAPGADAASGSDAGSPEPDAGMASTPFCLVQCITPQDCSSGSPAYDADNYACEGGACKYIGCNDDAECQSLGAYACRPISPGGIETCQRVCTTPADCDSGSAPYDADNHACESGICRYLGCNSDQECAAIGDFVCRTYPGASDPTCQVPCQSPADCDNGSAPFDADNYACVSSICVYQGCNGDRECQDLGAFVCALP